MKNPFYQTLKAQKEERDKFIDFYSSGVLFGLPQFDAKQENATIALPLSSARSNDENIKDYETAAAIENDQT